MRAFRVVWVLYLLAWTLPVVKGGVTLPDGLPGWQAFRVAASPLWPYEGVKYETWYGACLAVASAGTNFLMVATVWLVRRKGRGTRRWAAVASAVAFLVNAYWLVLFEDRKDLRPGYYLWWLSFLGIAYLGWRADRKRAREDESQAA